MIRCFDKFLKNAAKKGTNLIVLDVVKQNLMRHASHGLVFKPGTDVALLNAMANVILEEKEILDILLEIIMWFNIITQDLVMLDLVEKVN